MKKKNNILNPEGSPGFSATELLVVVAIMTLVSVSAIFSFSGLRESVALNRAANALAGGIRRAQNTSLAVTQVPIVKWPGAIPSTARIVRRVGIQLNKDWIGYFLFVDIDSSPPFQANGSYDLIPTGPNQRNEQIVGSRVFFTRRIRISNLSGCGGSCPDSVNIIFVAPEATAQIRDQEDGDSITEDASGLDIELSSPSGQTKHVIVRTSGQISIK